MESVEDRARRVLDRYLVMPVPPDPDRDDPDALAAWLDAEDEHVAAKAVAALEGRERVVTALHYFEDLSLDEIATLLGEGRDAVASICHRARLELARNYDLTRRYSSEQKQVRWRRQISPDERDAR
jgi:DNA-directed RNA polymerase specialized sigma24 family protein